MIYQKRSIKNRKFIESFKYAGQGIAYAWKTQRNIKIHFIVAILVLIFAFIIGFDVFRIIILLFTITLVIVTEMINTAIEASIDLFTGQFNPLAKIAKDVAAGAVLVTSITAVLIAVILFFPYLKNFFILLFN